MATLKLTDGQVEIIIDALEMADTQLRNLSDVADSRAAMNALKGAASEYAQLGQALKDGACTAAS